MVRITYVGAGFLALVAIIPTIDVQRRSDVDSMVASFYGGTGLLIAVSVAFDLVQKIDSHLVMRNYTGLAGIVSRVARVVCGFAGPCGIARFAYRIVNPKSPLDDRRATSDP